MITQFEIITKVIHWFSLRKKAMFCRGQLITHPRCLRVSKSYSPRSVLFSNLKNYNFVLFTMSFKILFWFVQ